MKRLFTFLLALMLITLGANAQVDYTSYLDNGTWTGNTGTYQGGKEYYSETAYTSGKILYETVTGLPAGTYTLQFYAVANMAWIGAATGSDIAQVYVTANGTAIQTTGVTVYGQTSCLLYNYPYEVSFTVSETSNTLEYGLQNIATGGNWYICQGWSLIRTDETAKTYQSGDVVEETEAQLSHWQTTGNNGSAGGLQYNDWSVEADESGMVTPFVQSWVETGNLSTATISHRQLTNLPEGYYEVSMDIRIFSQNGNVITSGTLFKANDASEDIDTGSDHTDGSYNNMTEVYGTYHLLAEVTEDGTLDISLTIPEDAAYNWIAWKNLKVVYDGESMPTLEYVEGDMNSDVEAAMQAAVDAYNASKSTDNYTAALAAIEAAEESVAQYAEIAALVKALDDAGKDVWETTTSASAYSNKTLAISDDISEDMASAQKAQTTAGTDWSYVLKNTGTWVNAISATNFQACPSLPTAHEIWSSTAWSLPSGATSAEAIYKRIVDLPAGEYTISFYAYGSEAASASRPLAFANDAEAEVAYASALVWNESSLYTLQCTVGLEGELDFGMKTQGAGNWYVMEEGSLTLVSLAAEATDTKSDYSEGDVATIYGHSYNVKSDNLVENHSFELGFDGWTDATANHNTITSSKFELRSDDAQDGEVYLVGTTNDGSSGSGSICTGWAIEAGKTYYFSYYVKGLGTATDGGYLRTDIVNELSDEDSGVIFATPTVTSEWQKIEYLFTNTDYSLLQVEFRWLNSQWGFDNFQLYVVEPDVELLSDDSEYTTGDDVTVDGKAYIVVSDNMFVNGGFNADMYGWTAAGYFVAADPDNFDVEEEGGFNEGAYLVASSAGTGSVKTPSQAIAVKEGKTYLFIGYTSGKTPDEGNERYSALFEMEDATTEASHTESDDKKYSNTIIELLWGADPQETATEWTQTIGVFTAETEYVGMRMGWSGGSYDGFQLYEVEEVPETIEWEMTAAEWGTIILPFDAEVPEGLTAYSCASVDGDELVLTEATTLASCTPYILKGAADTYSFTGAPENEKDKYQVGLLVGTLADMSLDEGDFSTEGTEYVLQNHDDEGLAFYPITSASEGVTLDAYHCYLNTGAVVTALRLPGMATAIQAVESDVIANDAIYDLSGRRVAKAVKGVYIQNGKKVLVK